MNTKSDVRLSDAQKWIHRVEGPHPRVDESKGENQLAYTELSPSWVPSIVEQVELTSRWMV